MLKLAKRASFFANGGELAYRLIVRANFTRDNIIILVIREEKSRKKISERVYIGKRVNDDRVTGVQVTLLRLFFFLYSYSPPRVVFFCFSITVGRK